MSIPGKLLIALLSALAVSVIAAEVSEVLTLGTLFGPTAIAALLSVLLSHKALPMPAGMASSDAVPRSEGASKSGSESATKREQKPRQQKKKRPQSGSTDARKREDKKSDRATAGASPNAGAAPVVDEAALEAGTVKWFNSSKGFGFLIRDNGEEVFVHHRSIVGEGRRNLSDGAAVRFRVVNTDKGPQAEDVQAEG